MTVAAVASAPVGAAAPTSPLCKDGSYRAAHPLICDTGGSVPGAFPGGGGGAAGSGGSGGLLDAIGDAVGGLTGGLL
jgi:hypothetical protein